MSMRFDEQFIKDTIVDVQFLGKTFPEDVRFSVDTRSMQEGDIFIAVQGAKIDGHTYMQDAINKGAAGLVVAHSDQEILKKIDAKKLASMLVMVVPNPLEALIQLAIAWRSKFTCPVIAITGSVGKTSTKEMLSNILTLNGNTFLSSQGNQNTKIGVSLNTLRLRPEHQMAIFEVGINKRGEMAEIARILRPTTAIITSIGHCHMEGLGSLSDIALEKRDVFKYFTEQSIGIVNGDQPVIAQVSYNHPVIKFGAKTTNQIQARKIRVGSSSVSCVMKIYKEKHIVVLPKPHTGIVFNALAAAGAAHLLGVSNQVIVKAIAQPLDVPGRFEQKDLTSFKGVMINDCYNANPESMKAALLAFQNIETGAQKIAILGDMLELGVNSPFWHRQLGRFLRKVSSLKEVILVGDMVKWTKKTAPVGLTVEMVPTWSAAIEKLQTKLNDESVVLVKGSRGIGLNHLVDAFTEKQK
ncbi:MAG: UDP-N-acetylmuramoyl-tripeptide--D-alanyl-D-alanine ligase [Candidatus Babeliales bacterium]|nr:UDP-N-acetylmuramoyl-tripeptide--D-alanyl-D-alanine ligase [Candidatus Babeliales bacterium]